MAGEIPSGEGSVFHFLDIFALGCGLEACSALWRGEPFWQVGAGVLGAVVFHLLGTKWPVIKRRLGPDIGSFLDNLAGNRRLRMALVAAIVGYFLIDGLFYIRGLRNELDASVTQRMVSKEQAQKLREYFAKHDAYAVSVKVVPHDQEAMEYAAQLFNAMRETNWDIDPPNHDGPGYMRYQFLLKKPRRGDLDSHGKPMYITDDAYEDAHDEWLRQMTDNEIAEQINDNFGLCINVEEPGQPTNPDPRHPKPEAILADGFRYADIEINCSGGASDRETYRLFLVVGHRPRILGKQEPILRKFGRWIEGLGE